MARGKGGQPGNTNATKSKPWADAIRRAVVQNNGEKLNRLADKLIACALEGDMAAMREIGDRLDGKAAQVITGEDGPVAFQITWRAPS
jgi:hypothetical protein